MKIKKLITITTILFTGVLFTTGCASKSLLTPGKEKSNCDIDSSKFGVCGNPANIYKYRNRIKKLDKTADLKGGSYYINNNGQVGIIKNGKIIKRASNNRKIDIINTGEENPNDLNDKILISNQGVILRHPAQSAPIRDMGLVQKIWFAQYQTPNDDLQQSHSLYTVIRKPSWVIGEKRPAKTENSKFIPSIISSGVINKSHSIHNVIDRTKIVNGEPYVGSNGKTKEDEENIQNSVWTTENSDQPTIEENNDNNKSPKDDGMNEIINFINK